MARTRTTFVPLGRVLGSTPLSPQVLASASTLAAGIWSDAVLHKFSSDAVTTAALPDNLPELASWFPESELREFGVEACPDSRREIVGTYDIDAHQDHIHGQVLFLVLHNDGLTFRQGAARHVTAPGEFFIFDDRLEHAVKSTNKPGAYVGLSIPLRAIA